VFDFECYFFWALPEFSGNDPKTKILEMAFPVGCRAPK